MIHKFSQRGINIVLDVNSGAVHVVDQVAYDVLDYYPDYKLESIIDFLNCKHKKDNILEAIEEIEKLRDSGLLFTNDSYFHQDIFRDHDTVIKALCLHIAHDCDLRCKYCFASQGDFKGDRSLMTTAVGKKSIDFLVGNSGNRKNLEVDFFGGEPLMNFDVVKEIIEYGRYVEKNNGKNIRFTITTNGILLNDEIIDYINSNMHNVVLSIDGRKNINDRMRSTINGRGCYDIILPKFIKMAKLRGKKDYFVRGTFTRHNLDFTNDVLHLADLGFKNISVEPVVSSEENDYSIREIDLPQIYEEYEKLSEEYIKRAKSVNKFNFFHFMIDLDQGPCLVKRLRGCGAGAEYMAVTPEGDLFPCHQFVGDDDFKLGNVFDGIINTSINRPFSKANIYEKEACRKCWAKYYCSGGCHANAYNFNNDVFIPYEIGCKMQRKRIECALAIKAELMGVTDFD